MQHQAPHMQHHISPALFLDFVIDSWWFGSHRSQSGRACAFHLATLKFSHLMLDARAIRTCRIRSQRALSWKMMPIRSVNVKFRYRVDTLLFSPSTNSKTNRRCVDWNSGFNYSHSKYNLILVRIGQTASKFLAYIDHFYLPLPTCWLADADFRLLARVSKSVSHIVYMMNKKWCPTKLNGQLGIRYWYLNE